MSYERVLGAKMRKYENTFFAWRGENCNFVAFSRDPPHSMIRDFFI